MRKRSKLILLTMLMFALCMSFSAFSEGCDIDQRVKEIMEGMTLQDKVAQMIITVPEKWSRTEYFVLHDTDINDDIVSKRPYGGIMIYGKNIESAEALTALNSKLAQAAVSPFILAEEEGGDVSRVALKLELTHADYPSEDGKTGDISKAYTNGSVIGAYLKEMGFNMNLAPMADLAISATNVEIEERCYGSDPATVASMSMQFAAGLQEQGIIAVYKHFPGIGNADTETEESKVTIRVKSEQLYSQDIMPFRAGISSGNVCIMMSSAIYEDLDSTRPATFSETIITGILRNTLSFNGVILSAPLNSTYITSYFNTWQMYTFPIKAGCDMFYLPSDPVTAINTIVSAVESKEIPESRINESVERILKLKLENGIIQ